MKGFHLQSLADLSRRTGCPLIYFPNLVVTQRNDSGWAIGLGVTVTAIAVTAITLATVVSIWYLARHIQRQKGHPINM